jgi:hypothetical protein
MSELNSFLEKAYNQAFLDGIIHCKEWLQTFHERSKPPLMDESIHQGLGVALVGLQQLESQWQKKFEVPTNSL